MKVLLVAEKDSTRDSLLHHLTPRGFDLIHYRHPIKAMDNIDEIEPEVVFFSAEDFPRHWKPFIKLLRESIPKEKTTFVLLKGDVFSFDEAAKAKHLEVNGIIREDLEDRNEYSRLEELLSRYQPLKEIRSEPRYVPEVFDNVEFIFTHPENNAVVTGALFDLSPGGAAFAPDDPTLVKTIAIDTVISRCSLKIEKQYLTVKAKVVRNKERLGLQFLDFDETQQTIVAGFIEKRAERELKNVLRSETARA